MLVISILTGCAMTPIHTTQQGEPLVWLTHANVIKNYRPNGAGQFIPFMGIGTLLGAVVANSTINAVTNEIHNPNGNDWVEISFFSEKDYNIMAGELVLRPLWKGFKELEVNRYYRLSQDEKGPVLLWCDDACQPQ